MADPLDPIPSQLLNTVLKYGLGGVLSLILIGVLTGYIPTLKDALIQEIDKVLAEDAVIVTQHTTMLNQINENQNELLKTYHSMIQMMRSTCINVSKNPEAIQRCNPIVQ